MFYNIGLLVQTLKLSGLACRWKRPSCLRVQSCLSCRGRFGSRRSLCGSGCFRGFLGGWLFSGFLGGWLFSSGFLGSSSFLGWRFFSGSFFGWSGFFGRCCFFSGWLFGSYSFLGWRSFFSWSGLFGWSSFFSHNRFLRGSGLFCDRFFCSCHHFLLDQFTKSTSCELECTKRFMVLGSIPAP